MQHCSETGPDEGRVKQSLFSHCAKYKVMIAVLKLNISLNCALQRSRQQTLSFLIIHSRYRYKEGSSIYIWERRKEGRKGGINKHFEMNMIALRQQRSTQERSESSVRSPRSLQPLPLTSVKTRTKHCWYSAFSSLNWDNNIYPFLRIGFWGSGKEFWNSS